MIRSGPKVLSDGRVTLREITDGDAENLFLWRSDRSVRGRFHSEGPRDFAGHSAFVAKYFSAENDDCWFVICSDGVDAGAVALYRSGEGAARSWEAGRIVLSPAFRGLHGFNLARRAILLLQEFARQIGHVAMRCEVLESNRVMLAIVRSVGFEAVGGGRRGGRGFLELEATLLKRTDESSAPS